MTECNKQKVLSVINSVIHDQHYYYKILQASLPTCPALNDKSITYWFSYASGRGILDNYREVTGANFEVPGFKDHPNFLSYTVLEQFRIRLLKLEQFRCHMLHYWKD